MAGTGGGGISHLIFFFGLGSSKVEVLDVFKLDAKVGGERGATDGPGGDEGEAEENTYPRDFIPVSTMGVDTGALAPAIDNALGLSDLLLFRLTP